MELSPNFMRKLPYYVCRANDNRSAAHVNVRLGKNLQHTSGLKLPPPKKNVESILAIPPTPPESPNQPLELYATVLKVHVHTCRLQQQLLADFSWWVVTTCLNCQRFSRYGHWRLSKPLNGIGPSTNGYDVTVNCCRPEQTTSELILGHTE